MGEVSERIGKFVLSHVDKVIVANAFVVSYPQTLWSVRTDTVASPYLCLGGCWLGECMQMFSGLDYKTNDLLSET